MSVYFDHNASSPLHPEVLDAMMPYLREGAANASSLHSAGRFARSAIETARGQVAALIHCPVESIIFTSGGSESNNFLLKGFIDYDDDRAIVSSQIEHPSLIEPLEQLERLGMKNTLQEVDALATKLEALVNKLPAIIRQAAG